MSHSKLDQKKPNKTKQTVQNNIQSKYAQLGLHHFVLSTEVQSPRFKDPVRELFLYAVLNTFEDMSHFFWEEGQETMAAALAASRIYKNMAGRLSAADAELKIQLKGLSK